MSIPENRTNATYYHTLPLSLQDVTYYRSFDTVWHCTSLSNTLNILNDGYLKPVSVKHSSVINPKVKLFSLRKETGVQRALHPLRDKKILWYSPIQRRDLLNAEGKVERYGNVVFSVKRISGYEGTERDKCSRAFNYYFIEMIHYLTQTATRILVTPYEYPLLLKYDPETKGGPWYYDQITNTHYHLHQCPHVNGRIVPNSVEFLKEQPVLQNGNNMIGKIWQENHNISYMRCNRRRRGVRVARDDWTNGNFRVALGVSAFMIYMQQKFPERNMDVCSSMKERLNMDGKRAEEEDKLKDAMKWAKEQLVLSKEKFFDASIDSETLLKKTFFHGPYKDQFSAEGAMLYNALFIIIWEYR